MEVGKTTLANDVDIKVAVKPHMPHAAVQFLAERMKTSQCYLEYGAGGSTRMATRLRIPSIYSVESDAAFARAVRRYVSHDLRGTEAVVITSDVGPTNSWGYPVDREKSDLWPEYPLGIWDRIRADGRSPDTILVDGRFRVACFLASLINAKPGSMILFDDYVGREQRYGSIENFVKPIQFVDRMAVFLVPDVLPIVDVAASLARYCMIKH